MYKLTMRRGKRSVEIGLFYTKYRAEQISILLGWNKSWKAIVEEV